MVVCDVRRIPLAVDILGDLVHRTRSVKRYAGDDVFKALRFKLLHERGHAAALKLEYTDRLAAPYHLKDLGIIQRYAVKIYRLAVVILYEFYAVLKNRKRSKSQEVELKKAYALDICFRKLYSDSIVINRKRRNISNVLTGYDYSRSVRSGISRKAFNAHSHVYDFPGFRIRIVSFFELSADLKGLLQGHSNRERYHLRELVALRYRHVKDSCNILYGLPCSKRTEGDYVSNSRLAVFLSNIVYCDLSSLVVEVNVEVRHRYSLRV